MQLNFNSSTSIFKKCNLPDTVKLFNALNAMLSNKSVYTDLVVNRKLNVAC